MENNQMESQEFLAYMDLKMPAVGDTVEGIVVSVTRQEVSVDINCGTEGTVYLNQLTFDQVESAHDVVKVGDSLKAVVKKITDEQILLSRTAILEFERLQVVKAAYEAGETLTGRVVRTVKGGVIVNVGVEAFMPLNMIDVAFVDNAEKFVGQDVVVRVVEFNAKNNRIKVSRKIVLAEQVKAAKTDQLSTLAVNDIVTGEVVRLQPYGAFVRFGSLEGLVHISEISHLAVTSVEEALTVGQTVTAKVLKVEGGKIQLSIKATLKTPFELFVESVNVGDVVEGTVTKVLEYGAFAQVAEGVEGLVHTSEYSWDMKASFDDVMSQGKSYQFRIIAIDEKTKRIALSLKQVEANPWTTLTFKVGDSVTGTVTNVTELGAFIKVAPYVEGLCHFSEASYNPYQTISNLVRVGDEVTVKVISLDASKRRLGLSLRQVKANPWASLAVKSGEIVTGVVTGTTDKGAYITLSEDIVGFLPMNQITEKRIAKVEEAISLNEEIKVKITRLEAKEQRLMLSVRRIKEDAEREEFTNYLATENNIENETLGDLFGEALKNLIK